MSNIFFNSWNQPEDDERLKLVFAGRFKDYGAYHVRMVYRRAKIWAALLSAILVGGISAIPLLASNHEHPVIRPHVIPLPADIYPADIVPDKDENTQPVSPHEDPVSEPAASTEYVAPVIREYTEDNWQGDITGEITQPGRTTYMGDGGEFEGSSGSDGTGESPVTASEPVSVNDVQVQCVFPGGEDRFREYFISQFEYPENCLEQGVEGYIRLRFVVDVNGRITRITAVDETESCPEFTAEAIRVLRMSPPWIPAQKNGKFVTAWRELPVRIGLR